MSVDRDLKMGRALESIPLPGLSEGYYSRLARRLELERPPARVKRRPRVLRIGVAAAVVAAAAAVVAFAVLPALRGGPETATAAEMLASLNAAGGHARVVRLTIVEQRAPLAEAPSPPGDGTSGRTRPRVVKEELTMSTSGDVRYSDERELVDALGTLVRTQVLDTYDARRRESMRQGETHPVEGQQLPDPNPYDHAAPPSVIVSRPSWGTSVFSTFLLANFEALSNSLRAVLAEADASTQVRLITYLGRPAWQADLTEVMPASDGSGGTAVTWRATVDRETGVLVSSELRPVAAQDKLPGIARSFRVTRLEVDPDLPAGWQRIDYAGRVEATVFDTGTRFGTPETVAARAWPTLVLVPREVPAGYRLTDVATRDYEGMKRSPLDRQELVSRSGRPRVTLWKRTHLDPSRQRVMLRYRRGFSSFVISIRPSSGGSVTGSSGPDPTGAEDVVLSGGYLEGAPARVWISSYFGGGPTLVTTSDRSRITITGDLTRQELLDVAGSITAVGDVDRRLPEAYHQ